MAFKDAAHTKDRAIAGLSKDPSGACKGSLPEGVLSCVANTDKRERWCIYCKAKNPPPMN